MVSRSLPLEFPSYVDDLKEILINVEHRLQPIPLIRRHVSRFVDGADMDEVYPNLWLGDCDAATNINYLLKHGISHVLNAADNKTGPARVNTGEDCYKEAQIKYKGLDLIDLPFGNVAKYFEEASAFIDEALQSGGVVLVHCRQGRSRSASIVAGYFMIYKDMTAAKAITRLKEIREIRPNNSFLQQIADLDVQLFRKKYDLYKSQLSSSSESDSDSDSDCEASMPLKCESLSHGKTNIVDALESCIEFSLESNIQIMMVDSGSELDENSTIESTSSLIK